MMGEVIRMEGREKRDPPPLVLQEDQLVIAAERRLSEGQGRGGWRLDRNDPRGRNDLIILARNLAAMRERLPHGEKSKGLMAAGFKDDGANFSTYVNNLCLSATVGIPSNDRIRRLTPKVEKYVAVACAIEEDRSRALANLFRGTSLDQAVSDDWSGKLSWRLDGLARRVAAATNLTEYFDDASSSNVCLADGEQVAFRLTSWLSETFHKTDFAEARHDHPEGAWLYDRSEGGTPKRGGPLFAPMVALDNCTRVWSTRLAGGDGEVTSCVFNAGLYLAIVPVAAALDEPCRIECWLLERPSASLNNGRKAVWQVQADQFAAHIRAGDDKFHPTDKAGFLAWSCTEEGRLFVEYANEGHFQSDLLNGSWWCAAATSQKVQKRLSVPRASGTAIAVPHGRRIETVVDDPLDVDLIDFHAAAPEVFPPPSSLALEMIYGLPELERRLTASAQTLVSAFRTFKREIALASPLSE